MCTCAPKFQFSSPLKVNEVINVSNFCLRTFFINHFFRSNFYGVYNLHLIYVVLILFVLFCCGKILVHAILFFFHFIELVHVNAIHDVYALLVMDPLKLIQKT